LFAVCAVIILGLMFLFGQMNTANVNTIASSEVDLQNELTTTIDTVEPLENYEVEISNRSNPTAIITTNYGPITLELFDDAMPITAGNFMNLAREGFYDGTKFHRVIESFMIQGGDPNTKTEEVLTYGTGGPGYTIPDEHIAGDKLTNIRGTIAMANSGPDSGGSQFFINLVDNSRLDWDKPPAGSKHPVFGQVIDGMAVVETIGQVETGMNNLPVEDVVVESVVIQD
jgi:peptidylprolyl isomerase